MNFLHPFDDEEDKTKQDLQVVRLDSAELSKMSLKCLKCPRLFPRRSNWVQHLNYAHRIRIELNTPNAARRRKAQLEREERMKQQVTMEMGTVTTGNINEEPDDLKLHLDKTQDINSAISQTVVEEEESKVVVPERADNLSLTKLPVTTIDSSVLLSGDSTNSSTPVLPFVPSDNSGIMVFSRSDIPPAKLKSHLLIPQKTASGTEKKSKKQRERVDTECPTCGQFFKFKNVYEDHVLKHSDPKPYKCGECDFQSESRFGLKAHLQTHGIGKQYQCSGCDKIFYNLHRLLKHEKTHQPRDRSYKCDICGKSFMDESVLAAHKKCHFKELTACELCGKKLSQKRMKEHMNLHTAENVYPCDLCDTVYRQKRSLDAHRKFKHGEGLVCTEKHVCSLCDQQFANHVTLEKHMLRHNEDNKKFTCSQCGQGFYTKAEVCNHEMTHLDPYQRPFVCHICFKTFTKEHSLKAHLLVHNPSKPLNCELCGKGFRWKNKLKEHMRTHTGEKPFRCRYCESRFTDCATRRYHEKKFHPEKAIHNSAGIGKIVNNDIRSANIQHTGDGRIIITRGSGANADYIITDEKDFNQKYGLLTETADADTSAATYVLPGDKDDKAIHNPPTQLIKLEQGVELVDNLQNAQLVSVSTVDIGDTTTNYIITQSNSSHSNQELTHMTTSDSVAEGTSHFVLDKDMLKQLEGDTRLIISQDNTLESMVTTEGETTTTSYVLTTEGMSSVRGGTGGEEEEEEDLRVTKFIVPGDCEQNFVIEEEGEGVSGYCEGGRLGGEGLGEEFVVRGDKGGLLKGVEEEGEEGGIGMFVEGETEQYIQLVVEGGEQMQFVVQSSQNE